MITRSFWVRKKGGKRTSVPISPLIINLLIKTMKQSIKNYFAVILIIVSIIAFFKAVVIFNSIKTDINLVYIMAMSVLVISFVIMWIHSTYIVKFNYEKSPDTIVFWPVIAVSSDSIAIGFANVVIGYNLKKLKK